MAVVVSLIDLIEEDGSTILIEIVTSVGTLQLIGACEPFDRDLVIDRAHVQGLSPGVLGRQGLNEIARKIMETADVDTIAVQGGVRSTGRNVGRPPKPFFARR